VWLTYSLIGLDKSTHLGASVEFFLFETPKVLMLLVLIVFVVGIIRSFFTAEKTRQMLAGRRLFAGNVLAALLGIPTPFCSCSAVPLFMGFVQAGVPLGVTLSFLIAAPMVNEVALVMLLGMFGVKIAALYLVTGLVIAILAGWVIGLLKMERHVEGWVYEMQAAQCCIEQESLTWADRIEAGRTAVHEIVGKVWPYLLVGIAVGSGIHGYVPEGLMARFMGENVWWSVPAAVAIGIPMYSNAAGVIPIVQALLEKGAALGTVLAFMMAVIALSLPEVVILRKVLKPRLIGAFVGIVAVGILIVGYLFNAVLGRP
jgi:uncharacterized membrane protein YraQ (UPF0718 family)